MQRRHIYCRHGFLARHKKDEQGLGAKRRVVHARCCHAQNVAIANPEKHRLDLIAVVVGAKYDDHLFGAAGERQPPFVNEAQVAAIEPVVLY